MDYQQIPVLCKRINTIQMPGLLFGSRLKLQETFFNSGNLILCMHKPGLCVLVFIFFNLD